jgi:hypothetical protein
MHLCFRLDRRHAACAFLPTRKEVVQRVRRETMLFDWVLLVAGLAGSLYVFSNARRLANRPRRGTEWKPSYRSWLLAAAAMLLIAVGAAIDLLGS